MSRRPGVFQRLLELVLDRRTARETEKQAQAALRRGTDPAAAKKNLSGVGKAFNGLKAVAARLFAFLAVGFSGRAIMNFANEIDNAMSTLRRQTGDTGQALEQLGADMREVFRTGPESIETVSEALSVLRTQTGLIGEPLQRLTRQVLDFSRVTGETAAAAAEITGQLLNRLGLDAEHAEGLLDRLTVAGQETGVSIAALSRGLLKGSDSLGAMGLSINQQIALLAQIEKRGGDLSRTAMALNTALVRMAREGVTDGAEAFGLLIAEIKEAPNDFEATNRAAAIFGDRMGATFAADVRQGRLDIDDLVGSLDNADGALRSTTDESRTFREQLAQAMNEVRADFVPLLIGTAEVLSAVAVALIRVYQGVVDVATVITGTMWLALEGLHLRVLQARRGFNLLLGRGTDSLDRQIERVAANMRVTAAAIVDTIAPIDQSAAATKDWRDVFNEVRKAAQGSGDAIKKTAEELRRMEQDRIRLLADAISLRVASNEEKLEALFRAREINEALKDGNLAIEERIRLTQNLNTLQSAGGFQEVELRQVQGPALRPLGDMTMPRKIFTEDMLDAMSERSMQLLAEQWMDTNADMLAVAERTAFGIMNAFKDGFDALWAEAGGLGAAMESLFRGIGGAALGALADLASSKVAENVAYAAENMAKAFGWLALGNVASAGAAKAAAAGHMKAAGLWAVLGGGAAAGQSAMGGGSSGGIPSGARDPVGRAADGARGSGPDINIYLDGVDPSNPRHQALVGQTSSLWQERTGGTIRLTTRR